MIHEFNNPVPVLTKLGPGYLFYVRDGGTWENDIFAVVLENGTIRHFRSDQITVWKNMTFDLSGSAI